MDDLRLPNVPIVTSNSSFAPFAPSACTRGGFFCASRQPPNKQLNTHFFTTPRCFYPQQVSLGCRYPPGWQQPPPRSPQQQIEDGCIDLSPYTPHSIPLSKTPNRQLNPRPCMKCWASRGRPFAEHAMAPMLVAIRRPVLPYPARHRAGDPAIRPDTPAEMPQIGRKRAFRLPGTSGLAAPFL